VRGKDDSVAEIRARYLVVGDGQNSRLGRELGTVRNKSWPMGMALRGYYTSDRHDEAWIDSHLDIRDPKGDVVPGYGWIFPLGDGRVNVGVGLLSTGGAWKGVNTTKLQEYFVSQTADAWGLNDETCCGPATGGRLPMGLALGPRSGPNTLTIGDAAGTVNPFQRRRHRLRLRDRAHRGRRRRRGAARQRLVATASLRRTLESAYGDYFKVARAFVRIISEPKILSACVGVGLRIEPLMKELLAIMANLMRNDKKGPAEIGYRALLRLSDVIPERAYDMLLNAGNSKD